MEEVTIKTETLRPRLYPTQSILQLFLRVPWKVEVFHTVLCPYTSPEINLSKPCAPAASQNDNLTAPD